MGKQSTKRDFIQKARSKHGNKYDYSLVCFKSNKDKVKIICPSHGVFQQELKSHFSGSGCPKCADTRRKEKKTLSKDSFKKRALEVHGDYYNYDKVKYSHHDSLVTIVCPLHGEFYQTPTNHLSGKGCQVCNGGQFRDKNFLNNRYIAGHQPTSLYLIEMSSPENGERFLKVGFTRKSLQHRFESQNTGPYQWKSLKILNLSLFDTLKIENAIIKNFSESKYQPKEKFCGHTECFDLSKKDEIHDLCDLIEEVA